LRRISRSADLKFFIGRQPSKRSGKRDLQWFPQREAKTLLEVCRELKSRWYAFLMVGFDGALRWGEITGLLRSDIDWTRQRVHVQRTWCEDGGRIELCKDGEDRWVKMTRATIAGLQAHCESMDLKGSLKRWTPEQHQLVFPNGVGRIGRYAAFHELVWRPLLTAAKLPYRKPHSMRHSYATWMLEEAPISDT
jgi:integrase